MTMGQQFGAVAYNGVVSHIVVNDARAAIEFYRHVFDAEVAWRSEGPDGRLWFAELKIQGGSMFLSDEFPEDEFTGMVAPTTLGGTPLALTVYVNDIEETVRRAQELGANVPIGIEEDQHWGDTMAFVLDPFGHRWSISTRVRNLDADELAKRDEEFFREHPEYTAERAQEEAQRWQQEHNSQRVPNAPPS